MAKQDHIMPDTSWSNSARCRHGVSMGELPVCMGSRTTEHTKTKRCGLASS